MKGTLILEASDDAYSTGKLVKSLVCQSTHNASAVAVPDQTLVGGCRIVVNSMTRASDPNPLMSPEHISVVKSTATTVEFPESQRPHEELKIVVKVV